MFKKLDGSGEWIKFRGSSEYAAYELNIQDVL